jgi:hypothetical protein
VVPALLHPAAKLRDRRLARVERDRGGLRDRVRLDRENPGSPSENLLDDGLLGREVEVSDVKDDGLGHALCLFLR